VRRLTETRLALVALIKSIRNVVLTFKFKNMSNTRYKGYISTENMPYNRRSNMIQFLKDKGGINRNNKDGSAGNSKYYITNSGTIENHSEPPADYFDATAEFNKLYNTKSTTHYNGYVNAGTLSIVDKYQIIPFLESKGGKNAKNWNSNGDHYYYIDDNGNIELTAIIGNLQGHLDVTSDFMIFLTAVNMPSDAGTGKTNTMSMRLSMKQHIGEWIIWENPNCHETSLYFVLTETTGCGFWADSTIWGDKISISTAVMTRKATSEDVNRFFTNWLKAKAVNGDYLISAYNNTTEERIDYSTLKFKLDSSNNIITGEITVFHSGKRKLSEIKLGVPDTKPVVSKSPKIDTDSYLKKWCIVEYMGVESLVYIQNSTKACGFWQKADMFLNDLSINLFNVTRIATDIDIQTWFNKWVNTHFKPGDTIISAYDQSHSMLLSESVFTISLREEQYVSLIQGDTGVIIFDEIHHRMATVKKSEPKPAEPYEEVKPAKRKIKGDAKFNSQGQQLAKFIPGRVYQFPNWNNGTYGLVKKMEIDTVSNFFWTSLDFEWVKDKDGNNVTSKSLNNDCFEIDAYEVQVNNDNQLITTTQIHLNENGKILTKFEEGHVYQFPNWENRVACVESFFINRSPKGYHYTSLNFKWVVNSDYTKYRDSGLANSCSEIDAVELIGWKVNPHDSSIDYVNHKPTLKGLGMFEEIQDDNINYSTEVLRVTHKQLPNLNIDTITADDFDEKLSKAIAIKPKSTNIFASIQVEEFE
jgi:hypothetical protein